MKPISVIIPTYKVPEALDYCLRSCIENQTLDNEIIVVVDGTLDLNRDILKKYGMKIRVINFEENQGLCKATNEGVLMATNTSVLVVNDDNVFPRNWDINLLQDWDEDTMVLTPNQIEPVPSPFRQFHIKNFGRNPKEFNYSSFLAYEEHLSEPKTEETGSTLPFLISRTNYFRTGGWDENYPLGVVVDWEFFMKCQMMGLKMVRTYRTHIYHFGSLTTKGTKETTQIRMNAEKLAWKYAAQKWGKKIQHDMLTNLKYL